MADETEEKLEPVEIERLKKLTPDKAERLRSLFKQFKIPPYLLDDNPAGALTVLTMIEAMPLKKDHWDRRNWGLRILDAGGVYFPISGPEANQKSVHFFSELQFLVITMQEIPSWYWKQQLNNRELVDSYKLWLKTQYWLGTLGIGSVAQIVNGFGGEMIKHGKIGAGPAPATGRQRFARIIKNAAAPSVQVGLKRLIGITPIVDAVLARWGLFVPGVGPILLGVTAVLAVMLVAANREVIDIMETITYRFRNKSLDEDLYREAVTYVPPLFNLFIPTPDPPPIKKFQDMR